MWRSYGYYWNEAHDAIITVTCVDESINAYPDMVNRLANFRGVVGEFFGRAGHVAGDTPPFDKRFSKTDLPSSVDEHEPPSTRRRAPTS